MHVSVAASQRANSAPCRSLDTAGGDDPRARGREPRGAHGESSPGRLACFTEAGRKCGFSRGSVKRCVNAPSRGLSLRARTQKDYRKGRRWLERISTQLNGALPGASGARSPSRRPRCSRWGLQASPAAFNASNLPSARFWRREAPRSGYRNDSALPRSKRGRTTWCVSRRSLLAASLAAAGQTWRNTSDELPGRRRVRRRQRPARCCGRKAARAPRPR